MRAYKMMSDRFLNKPVIWCGLKGICYKISNENDTLYCHFTDQNGENVKAWAWACAVDNDELQKMLMSKVNVLSVKTYA